MNGFLLKSDMLVSGNGIKIVQGADGKVMVSLSDDASQGASISEYPFTLSASTPVVEITYAQLGVVTAPLFTVYQVKDVSAGIFEMVSPDAEIGDTSISLDMTNFPEGNYILLYTDGGISPIKYRRDNILTPMRSDDNNIQCVWLDDGAGRESCKLHRYQYNVNQIRFLVGASVEASGNIALKLMVNNVLLTTITVPVTKEVRPYSVYVPQFSGGLEIIRDHANALDTFKDGEGNVYTALIYDIWTTGD